MRPTIRAFTWLVASALVVGLQAPAIAAPAHPDQGSSLADELYSYEDLIAHLDVWEGKGAHVEFPGTSEEGRAIPMVVFGSGPVTVLYTSGLHANEASGIEGLIAFIDAALGDVSSSFDQPVHAGVSPDNAIFRALASPEVRDSLLDRIRIVAFPMMDPDGVANGYQDDRTTNIDYSTKLRVQSRVLDYAVDRFRPDAWLDSHASLSVAPDPPDIWVGLVEPAIADRAVLDRTHQLAGDVWKAAAAVGATLELYEEKHACLQLGRCDDPFASADDVYWGAASRALPLTQESFQIRGIPAFFTEAFYGDGSNSYPDEAFVENLFRVSSLQEVTMAGLALSVAGLTDGTRPFRYETIVTGAGVYLDLPRQAGAVYATAAWGTGHRDYNLFVDAPGGRRRSVATQDSLTTMYREARAVFIPDAQAGRYSVSLEARPGSTGEVTIGLFWNVSWPRPMASVLDQVLDPREPKLCTAGTSAYHLVLSSTSQTDRLTGRPC